ncbi:hypothetical protein D3C76_1335840 [compost metagenome]
MGSFIPCAWSVKTNAKQVLLIGPPKSTIHNAPITAPKSKLDEVPILLRNDVSASVNMPIGVPMM